MNRCFRCGALWVPMLVSLGLTGCAQYQWRKQGATEADFNRDRYACQMEAASVFPAAIVTHQVSDAYAQPATTNCASSGTATLAGGTLYGNSNTNCTTTPGLVLPPVEYTADANKANRENAGMSCMYARGYQYVRIK